jgi:hypothetical protein
MGTEDFSTSDTSKSASS